MNYTEYYNKDNLQKLQNLDKSTLETIIKDDEKEDWNVSYVIKNIKALGILCFSHNLLKILRQ